MYGAMPPDPQEEEAKEGTERRMGQGRKGRKVKGKEGEICPSRQIPGYATAVLYIELIKALLSLQCSN